MTGQTDALVLMERALASPDPLELALVGCLSAYKGRTFDEQRRSIEPHVDWCLQNDLPPLEADRPHIELVVRWCESQPSTRNTTAAAASVRHGGVPRTSATPSTRPAAAAT